MKHIENDLTNGSVFAKLWKFTLPFIGANLIQTLYGMVDLYIVGRYATTADVSAVSIAGTITATLLMILIGLSVGATVIVGQRFGAGDRDSLQPVSATAFSLAWIVGIALAIICALSAIPLLKMINTPAEAMQGASSYLFICSVGFIFQSIYNILSGILRGVGDSKSPLLFVGVASALNILGDLILVWGLGMGAAGAAWATMLAQAFCMIFGILHVKRRGFPFDFKLSSYRIDKKISSELLHVGIPVALQEFLVLFSFVIIEGIVNSFGLQASAAAGILDKIFLFATIPTNSFNAAISAMVAQNIGAKKEDRAKKCLWYGILLSEIFALVFFILATIIPAQLIGIFTTDAAVIEQGCAYYVGYKYDYVLCALAFCVNGFINGTGHTRLTLISNFVSTYAVRVPGCLLVMLFVGGGLLKIGYILPLASMIQVVVGFAFFFTGKWRKPVSRPGMN